MKERNDMFSVFVQCTVSTRPEPSHDLWRDMRDESGVLCVVFEKCWSTNQKNKMWNDLSALSGDDEKQFILKYVQEQQIIRLLKLIIITPVTNEWDSTQS